MIPLVKKKVKKKIFKKYLKRIQYYIGEIENIYTKKIEPYLIKNPKQAEDKILLNNSVKMNQPMPRFISLLNQLERKMPKPIKTIYLKTKIFKKLGKLRLLIHSFMIRPPKIFKKIENIKYFTRINKVFNLRLENKFLQGKIESLFTKKKRILNLLLKPVY